MFKRLKNIMSTEIDWEARERDEEDTRVADRKVYMRIYNREWMANKRAKTNATKYTRGPYISKYDREKLEKN